MSDRVSAAIRDESGSTAIEYSLIVGSIAVVVVGAVISIGADLVIWLQSVADAL